MALIAALRGQIYPILKYYKIVVNTNVVFFQFNSYLNIKDVAMKRSINVVVMALFTLSLFGCNTVKGVGRDVEKVGEKIEDAGRR